MRRFFLSTLALLVPLSAVAFDFTVDLSADYSDGEYFSREERVAISTLSAIGAVKGNPDGSFAAGRTLNRAEFVKIALLVAGHTEDDFQEPSSCFRDVPANAWFNAYVCFAESRGIVQGYPDGLFHPERTVNYAEALKILAGLFDYALPEPPANERWAWYTPFLRAAEERGVALEELEPGAFLTRGQMARLAAAAYAEHLGELEAYRDVEGGAQASESRSSSEMSSSSASAVPDVTIVESSSAVSSASSSIATRQRYPAVSRQILLSARSLPIADGVVRNDVGGDIRLVTVRFRQQLQSVSDVYLVDQNGKELAKFTRGSPDNTDGKYRTWEAVLPSNTLRISANVDQLLAIEVQTKTREAGGAANELLEVTAFSAFVQQDGDGSTRQLIPTSTHLPQSQTVQALLTSVQNGPTAGEVRVGKKMHLASFQFAGMLLQNADLVISQMQLAVETSGVTLSNWYVATTDRPTTFACSTNQGSNIVSCDAITDGAGAVGSGVRTLNIYADVALQPGVQNGTVRVSLGDPGTIGRAGALAWSDGTGNYNWIDWPGTTVFEGPLWHVR